MRRTRPDWRPWCSNWPPSAIWQTLAELAAQFLGLDRAFRDHLTEREEHALRLFGRQAHDG